MSRIASGPQSFGSAARMTRASHKCPISSPADLQGLVLALAASFPMRVIPCEYIVGRTMVRTALGK